MRSVLAAAALLPVLALAGAARAATTTIFTTQAPPGAGNPDSRSVELGVRFRSDVAGQVTGLRFYKTPGNTGAHTGHLWSNTGTLLGSLTFSGETASGWQTGSFMTPIAIQAGVTYVASYHTASGYAVTRNYFTTSGVDNAPLHALRNGVAGVNGVFFYSSNPAFPSNGTRESNYWVDVVFSWSAPNPVPVVSDLVPGSATAGGPAFDLQVAGTGFVTGSVARWNGADRPTTVVSSSALSVAVSSALIASPGASSVTVFNPAPGGGLSAPFAFTVFSGDTVPPSVALSSPPDGALLRGTVTLSAAAPDAARAQFKVDGAALGAPDAAPPFTASWNTALAADGPHSLTVVAWDAANNASTSAPVSVMTDNAPPVISSVAAAAGPGVATVSWRTSEPSSSQVDYGLTTAYGSSTPFDPVRASTHAQLLAGLAPGNLYHYRVRSVDAAGNAAVSGDAVFSTPLPPGCLLSSGVWRNASSSPQSGAFTAEFEATPHATLTSGPMGLSNGPATAFSQLAATVRFYTNGQIQARDGSAYVSSTILYAPGVSHRFRFSVDMSAHRYSVQVSTPGAVERSLATDYAFRPEQGSATVLSDLGFIAEASSITVCGFGAEPVVTVDTTPPSVSLSSPSAGARLRGVAALSAMAADAGGVAEVRFLLDGAPLGPPDGTAPYSASWDTALSSDGTHVLAAVARDAAGNVSTAAPVSVSVDNTAPLLSSVTVVGLWESSAAVSWLTDEPTDAWVEFGTSAVYGSSTALGPSGATEHLRLLGGLAAGTTYHFRARSEDAAGNAAFSPDAVFTTDDLTAPEVALSSPSPGALLRGPVVLRAMATDGGIVAGVQFLLDGEPLGPPDAAPPYTASWDTALSSDGAHALSAAARDGAGNVSTAAPVSVSVDNTAPLLGSVAVAVWSSSASVSWFTDEPADARVEFGTSAVYGSSTALGPSGATEHLRPLSGLAEGTTYHFRVLSEDAAGNAAASPDAVFATGDSPPQVSLSSPSAGALLRGVTALNATATDAGAVVELWFLLDGEMLGSPDVEAPYAATWDTALSSDGPHALAAAARDGAGNVSTSAPVAVSVDNTPPSLGPVTVTGIGSSSAAVSWITDEPADGRVEYGTSTAYGSASAPGPAGATEHLRLLSGLAPGTTYHFRARSEDAAGNAAFSPDGIFTTDPAPPPPACQSASAGQWRELALPEQSGVFAAVLDVTPGAAGLDGVVGFSQGPAASPADLAAALRFNAAGFLDVRHSTGYARMTPFPYAAGVSYRVEFRVTVPGHLYDVYVSSPGAPRNLLARDYPFQAGHATKTRLDRLSWRGATGSLTSCEPLVSPSTGPWDGVRELYATAGGSKTWYAAWDNGLNRSFGSVVDPLDPWFDSDHGTANYAVDAVSGVFKVSGGTPRMYIHHPDFVQGSSSLTVADAHAKQWRDVELTVYAMRVADTNVNYAGIAGIVRTNHGVTGDETVHLCDTRGMGARFRYDGRVDFAKEISHPTWVATASVQSPAWSGRMPFNTWIGYKFVAYDLSDGRVRLENYMDMTDGAGGGSWTLVHQLEDDGSFWGRGSTSCAAGVDPRLPLSNAPARPGSESGLPNASVYFRSDGVGANGLLYKKMSVREIVAPAGGGTALLASGFAPAAAPSPFGAAPLASGFAPAAAPSPFASAAVAGDSWFRDLYTVPHPSRRGERVTIRLEAGPADSVEVAIFDLDGRRMHGGSAVPIWLDGGGTGARLAYEFHWDPGEAEPVAYTYRVIARRQGVTMLARIGRLTLVE